MLREIPASKAPNIAAVISPSFLGSAAESLKHPCSEKYNLDGSTPSKTAFIAASITANLLPSNGLSFRISGAHPYVITDVVDVFPFCTGSLLTIPTVCVNSVSPPSGIITELLPAVESNLCMSPFLLQQLKSVRTSSKYFFGLNVFKDLYIGCFMSSAVLSPLTPLPSILTFSSRTQPLDFINF